MQTRVHSLIEQIANVGSGFFIALLVWAFVIKPVYDIDVSAFENLEITMTFTVVSIIRGYVWRRLFNWHTIRKLRRMNDSSVKDNHT